MKTQLDAPAGREYVSVDGTYYLTRRDGTIEAYDWHLPALYAKGYRDHVEVPEFVPGPPTDVSPEPEPTPDAKPARAVRRPA